MSKIYGHKWVSAYGEADDGTWRKGLADMTPDHIARGIMECLKRHDPWPPTLPEFRAMAKPNTPAYHKPFPKLLDQPRDPSIAERELARMKRITKQPDAEADAEREAMQVEDA